MLRAVGKCMCTLCCTRADDADMCHVAVYVLHGIRFYQHLTSSTTWTWGLAWAHAASSDLVRWQHLPIAITPTPGGPDADGCFSGQTYVASLTTRECAVLPACSLLQWHGVCIKHCGLNFIANALHTFSFGIYYQQPRPNAS